MAPSTGTAAVCTMMPARIRRRFNGKRWIACRLSFRGWHRDAVDAAGPIHRAVLPGRGDRVRRRPSTVRALPARGLRARSCEIWRAIHPGQAGADAIDAQLHARARRPGHARPATSRGADGRSAGRRVRAPRRHAVSRDADAQLLRWTPSGYRGAVARPARRRAILITPPSSVEVLRTGWRRAVPLLHPSAT